MRRWIWTAVTVVTVVGAARPAAAEEAAARPPRAFQAPTAWLRPRDTVHATAGIGYNSGPFAAVVAGLGGVAELDATVDDLNGETRPTVLFKMGFPAGRRAAVAVGYRKSFAGVRTAQGFLAASADLGQVRVHAGAEVWAVDSPLVESHLAGVRPLAGLEWAPALFPRTTVIADLVWAPRAGGTTLEWVSTTGARFRFARWGWADLAVQFREHDLLDRPGILVRINGTLSR